LSLSPLLSLLSLSPLLSLSRPLLLSLSLSLSWPLLPLFLLLLLSAAPAALAQPSPMASLTIHLQVGFNYVPPGTAPFATQNPQATWPVSEYMTYLESQSKQKTPPPRSTELPKSMACGEFLEQLQDRPTTMTLNSGKLRGLLTDKIPARVEVPKSDNARQPRLDPLSKEEMDLVGLSFFQDIEHHAQLSSQGDKKGTLLIVLKWQLIARNHPDRIEEITRKIALLHGFKNFLTYINAEVEKHKANL